MHDRFLRISIALSALLIGVSVAYYFMYFIPQRDRVKMELQAQELEFKKDQEANKVYQIEQEKEVEENRKNERGEALTSCLGDADTTYSEDWENECKSRGLNPGCSLPLQIANVVEKNQKEAKDLCLRQYQK